MKHLPRIFLAGFLALHFPIFPLRAQAPAEGDPFIKDPAGAAAAKKTAPWRNSLFVLEVYALDKNDAFTVLDAERGSAARYRRVLDLAKAGKARLDTLTALATRNGQRAVTESIDEVRYPTAFLAGGGRNGMATPTAWETRNAGDTFEFEPVLSPDGLTCDLNLVPQRVSLAEFRDFGAPIHEAPTSQPIFNVQKLATSTTLTAGEPHYLGTLSPPTSAGIANGAAASEVWLAFLHLNLQGPTSDELKPPAKPPAWSALQLEYSCYSLDRAQAREILLASAALNAPWEKLQALVGEKKPRLEHIASIKTKSGQRAVTEEVHEVRFAIEYSPESETVPGYAKKFEVRNTGVTVEVEPLILPDGLTVDMNNIVQSVASRGNLKVTGVAARYLPQPLFETRRVTTSQSVLAGRHQLIGTLNPPGADGVNDRADTGRTWLLFVRATPNDP